MHGGFAFQPFNGSFQRGDPPVIDFIKEDVKRWFIELNNIYPGGF